MTNHTTDLIKDVDRCVACGLCLDSCPTYQATQCEGYSPRGRILLAAGLASGRLAYSERASDYLQSCLHCGSCEQVCPAHVAYGKIIDQGKVLLHEQGLLKPLPGWLRLLTHSVAWRSILATLIALWQKSGLQKLFRERDILSACGAERLANFEAMLPSPSVNRGNRTGGKYKAPAAEKQNCVQLFSGCVGAIVERPTLAAAKALLEASAYRVTVSKAQQCCGALYQHNGETDKARQCLRKNMQQMGQEPLISCASGCAAHWQQFAPTVEHYDILDYLLERDACADLQFEPLAADVALHTPCTAKTCTREPREPQTAQQLLSRIAGLRIHPISAASGDCCGAGGADLLRASRLSETLINTKIEALQESGASILLTSNSGCAMHFRRALYRRKIDIAVMHPCVLLYQQLRRH